RGKMVAKFESEQEPQRRVTVVSCDSHAGPRVEEDLRPYCPPKYLGEFDGFAAENKKAWEKWFSKHESTETGVRVNHDMMLNQQTAGHYDMSTRLREMDWDGVAAEVIFHGSQNNESIPFI